MSIYDDLGGEATVRAAVDDFYRRVLGDPHLAGYFAGVDLDRLKAHQRAFLSQALAGPATYTGRSMHAAHAALGITDTAFDRVLGHLMDTLIGAGVGATPRAVIAAGLAPLRADIVTAPAA